MLYKIKNQIRKIVPSDFILFMHKLQAIMANVRFGFPSKKLKIIAVAGTKGKTTTTNMITRILEDSGHKVAMLSTANFQIGEKKWLNDVKLTTPSASYVQKFLRKAVDEKCEYAVLEASSHGMVQNRYWGIGIQTAIITNLTSDHLDYHKTFENYKNSHLGLISKGLKTLIVNYDDINTHEILNARGDFAKKIFTLKSEDLDSKLSVLRAENIIYSESGSEFDLDFGSSKHHATIPLMGEFNIYNALGAIAVCSALDIGIGEIMGSLKKIKNIPGRLEKIDAGQDFEVIVDYAHSPESLENVYKTVKPYVKGRMIAVLGGTGDRDKTYRSKGGSLAEKYADVVFVTNEDPYSEEVEDIIDQVMSGITHKTIGENLFRISDRKEAIQKAISMAQKGDLVIITGKGCEQFMICKDQKIPWDDREIARQALIEIRSHAQ
jgi:UDP-N-acetylmuramoyl-L-alanyl-D-glutamate--2,6-diaminopimelate ligase